MRANLSTGKLSIMLLAVLFILGLMPLASANAADGILRWSTDTFEEDEANDGSIDNYIVVNLINTGGAVEFVQASDMVHQRLVDVDNLPEGLTCVVEATNENTCKIHLYGKAENHSAADDVENLKIEFLNAAFTSDNADSIEDNGRNNLTIDFIGDDEEHDGSLVWSSTVFTESEAGDGSISNTITVSIDRGDDMGLSFEGSSDMVADEYAETSYLPAGLSCIIDSVSDTECTITLKGKAQKHGTADNIDYLRIEFLDDAFSNGNAADVENSAMHALEIVFNNNAPAPVIPTPSPSPSLPTGNIESVLAPGSIEYLVNGMAFQMDVAPFTQDGRILVPLRYLAYCLGMTDDNIVWNQALGTATLTEGDKVVVLQPGSLTMRVNGTARAMDVAPIAGDGRLFLPARFVVEAFDGTVEWNTDTQTVVVKRTF